MEQLLVKEECSETIDGEIKEQTKMDDLDEEVTRAIEYREHIISRKTKIGIVLRKAQRDAVSVSSYEADFMHYNVKLPKLLIDKYAEDINQLQYFWGQFETAVHQNHNLTKTDKFSYLRSYLIGVAANVVTGLSLTKANYDSTIPFNCCKIGLDERFFSINVHMTKPLNLNPVKNVSDIKALKALCEIQICSLAALGAVPHFNKNYT